MVSVLLVGLAGSGCGDDSEPPLETSIDETQRLDELDDQEAQRLCDDVSAWSAEIMTDDRLHRFACIFAASFAATDLDTGDFDEAVCQTTFDECSRQPVETEPTEETCTIQDVGADCDITVREYLDCTEEQMQATVEVIDGFACQPPSDDPTGASAGPACSAVYEKCPALDPSAVPE